MALVPESNREMKLLLRSLQPEIFRLIFVQHNHRQVVEEVLQQLHATYPDRSVNILRIANQDYRGLTTAIYRQERGILVIEDFQEILKKPDIFVGFNQRRDKIAQYPLALICFVPTGNEILRACMKKVPDLWSFRNLVIELIQEPVEDTMTLAPVSPEPEISTLGGRTIQGKEKELNRLISRLEELQGEPDSAALINTYYPQILQLLLDTGAYQRGLEYAEQFVKATQEDHSNQHPSTTYSDALAWKAKFCSRLGLFVEAKDLLEKALSLDISNYSEKHPSVGLRQNDLALVYQDLGQYKQAKALFETVLTSAVDNYGDDQSSIAALQANLGLVYKDLGQYEQAKELLEKSLAYILQNYKEEDYDTVVALGQSNLAGIYHDLGKYEEAQDLLEKALASDLHNYGEHHPTVARRQSKLAMVYRDLGRYDEACDLLEKALLSDLHNYGENHPAIAVRRSDLAVVNQNLGNYQQAKSLLEEALMIDIANFGEDHPTVARDRSNLALIYRDLGEYERAQELLEAAIVSNVATYGENHPAVAMNQGNLASVYENMNEYEKARELIKNADTIFSHTLGKNHPYTRGTKSFLKQLEGK